MDGLKVIVKAVAINDREIFGEADYASEREHVAGRMRRVMRARCRKSCRFPRQRESRDEFGTTVTMTGTEFLERFAGPIATDIAAVTAASVTLVLDGELLKLGIDVSQTTVAKYMAKARRPSEPRLKNVSPQSC